VFALSSLARAAESVPSVITTTESEVNLMPLKLNVGLSRKVGEPNYGSRGASVNLELEVDASLIAEPANLKERIRQCFGLVKASLAEELNGGNGHHQPSNQENGHQQPRTRPTNGNGTSRYNGQRNNSPRPATLSQVKAIYGIARNQHIDLAQFLQERFQVERPDDLTIREASQVIDELKSSDARAAS
jgi:hypothetical protein